MKLRDHETGKVWTITSVFASDGAGETRLFRGGFTIIDDEPSTAAEDQELKLTLEANSILLAQLKYEIKSLLARVDKLETTAGYFNL